MDKLDDLARKVREHRLRLLELCYRRGPHHIGGDLSCAELLVALFHHAMQLNPKNPDWAERDRFVLSKGHAAAALYLVMAERSYFPLAEVMDTYKGFETRFGPHPCKAACRELECSTGALGHGIPLAAGLSLAARLSGGAHRVYCLAGDGELAEGSNWEAAMMASHWKLGNLVVVVDRNGLGLDGPTEEIMPLEPLADKWRAFGWSCMELDGHDLAQIVAVLDHLPPPDSGTPTVLLARTVKGKGISFMEDNALFHNGIVNEDQYQKAKRELEEVWA